ncbi:unnamed protein product [Brassicogethes aeneus]|uniref:Uncharacterized protein n=1 Tax=Brassicogethes aeneus TaxID=1431903 RepID=A0A9P0ATE4_BRAAE|nr:unnamed protein product [Brassicogethes aeneus]
MSHRERSGFSGARIRDAVDPFTWLREFLSWSCDPNIDPPRLTPSPFTRAFPRRLWFYLLCTLLPTSHGSSAISKEEAEEHNHGKMPYNGYSDEFLDRLEPNGNIPAGKGDIRYGYGWTIETRDATNSYLAEYRIFGETLGRSAEYSAAEYSATLRTFRGLKSFSSAEPHPRLLPRVKKRPHHSISPPYQRRRFDLWS